MGRLLALVLLTLTLAACDTRAPRLKLVTGQLAIDREIADALAELMADDPDVAIDLYPAALDAAAALDAIDAGQADLALVENNVPFRSTIRTVLPVYSSILHIAYRRGRDARDGRTLLRGATVFAGAPGSPARAMLERIVPNLGLTMEDLTFVADLKDKPDVLVVFAPISPDRVKLFRDYQLFSLGTPQMIGKGSVVDAVSLLFPQLRPFVIPEGVYGELTAKPIVTVAVDTALVGSERLQPATVYDLVQRLLALRAALAAARPDFFRSLSGDFDAASFTFAIHEGTRAFQLRNAPTIYERFAGVVEAALTILIATLSASLGFFRFVKYRRKNRIDQFYKEVVAMRRSLDDPLTAEQRQTLLRKLRSLEDEAFELLGLDRLEANESFQIFISLVSDVRQELVSLEARL